MFYLMSHHRMDESQRELYQWCLFFPRHDNRQPSEVEQRTIDRLRANFPEECRLLERDLEEEIERSRATCDLRCHAGKFNSQRGNTMPSILYDSFDQKTNEVIEYFAEVEDDDPRLLMILGYARIHSAIRDLIRPPSLQQHEPLALTIIAKLNRQAACDGQCKHAAAHVVQWRYWMWPHSHA